MRLGAPVPVTPVRQRPLRRLAPRGCVPARQRPDAASAAGPPAAPGGPGLREARSRCRSGATPSLEHEVSTPRAQPTRGRSRRPLPDGPSRRSCSSFRLSAQTATGPLGVEELGLSPRTHTHTQSPPNYGRSGFKNVGSRALPKLFAPAAPLALPRQRPAPVRIAEQGSPSGLRYAGVESASVGGGVQGGERASPRRRCRRRRPVGGGLVTAAASAAAADLAVFAGGCAAILCDSILICTGLAEPRRERARAWGGGGRAGEREGGGGRGR